MAILRTIKVRIAPETDAFRSAIAATQTAMNDFAKNFQSKLSQIDTLSKGTGARFYAQGMGKGAIDAATAQQVFAKSVDQVLSHVEDLRRGLLTIVGTQQNLQAANVATSDTFRPLVIDVTATAHAYALVASPAAATAAAITQTSAPATAATAAFRSMYPALRVLGLVNYDVTRSMKEWNVLDVARGTGPLIKAFFGIKYFLTGIIHPSKMFAFALTQFVVPALQAAGVALSQVANNPAAQQLGASLSKLGGDLMVLSKTTRVPLWLQFINGTRMAISVLSQATLAVGGFVARLAATAAINALRGVVQGVTQAVTQFALAVGTRAVTRLFSLSKNLAMAAGRLVGLKSSAKSTESSLKSLGSTGSKVGSQIRTGITLSLPGLLNLGLIAGGVAATFKGMSTGFQLAADVEQAEIAWTTMLGSAEQAKGMLQSITEFSKSTPFELPGLRNAARDAFVFGTAQDQILPTMRVLGDIASGVNAPLDEMAQLYGKVQVAGKLTGETLQQFQTRSIPMQQKLAEAFGVTGAEMTKMISEGKIGFPDVQKVLAGLSAEGGIFHDKMKNQAQGMKGIYAALSTTVGQNLMKIAAGMTEAFDLKAGLQNIVAAGQWFETNAVPVIVNAFTAIAGFVMPIVSGIAAFVASNWGLITAVTGAAFKAAYEIIVAIGDAIGKTITYFFGTQAHSTFSGFAETIQFALLVAEFAFTHWKDLVKIAFLNVFLGVVRLGGIIVHHFTVRIPAILSWFANNWRDVFQTLFNFTAAIFTNLGKNVANAMTEIWAFIKSGGTGGLDFTWTPLTEGFINTIKELPNIAAREMGPLESFLQTELNSATAQLGKDFEGFLEKRIPEIAAATPIAAAPKLDIPEFKISDALAASDQSKTGAKDSKNVSVAALERGSSEAIAAIAQNKRGKETPEKQLETLKSIDKRLEKQEKAPKFTLRKADLTAGAA